MDGEVEDCLEDDGGELRGSNTSNGFAAGTALPLPVAAVFLLLVGPPRGRFFSCFLDADVLTMSAAAATFGRRFFCGLRRVFFGLLRLVSEFGFVR